MCKFYNLETIVSKFGDRKKMLQYIPLVSDPNLLYCLLDTLTVDFAGISVQLMILMHTRNWHGLLYYKQSYKHLPIVSVWFERCLYENRVGEDRGNVKNVS